MDRRVVSSGRVPALQAQSTEFKSESQQKKSIKERKTLNYKYNACHIELFLCIHKNSYIDKYKIDILIGCFLVSFSCFFAVLEIKLGAL
jgi:hypothetical protein